MSKLRVDELESLSTGKSILVDEIDSGVRQDLTSPDKGALLVRGAAIYVNTIADLQALPTSSLVDGQQVQVKEYLAGTGVGGGEFYWDAASTTTANGVTVFGSSSSGRWFRKNQQTVCVTWAGAIPGSPDDQTEIFDKVFSNFRDISIPQGAYYVSSITPRNDVRSIIGEGNSKSSVTIRHLPGSTGRLFGIDSGRVTNATISGLYFVGNGEEGETHGFDLTGFSYCRIESVRVRLFKGDGIVGYGPPGRQFTNNTFTDVTSNNNKGHGIRLQATAHANTFNGCEFAGNGLDGIHHLGGSGNFYGEITAQGNSQETAGSRQIYFNGGTANQVFGYCEPGPYNVEFDLGSRNNSVNIRTSYPLWQSYIDRNLENHFSTGTPGPEQHLFKNPYFANYYGREPEGVERGNTVTKIDVIDGIPAIVFGDGYTKSLRLLLDTPDTALQGGWVTVILDLDLSGVTNLGDAQSFSIRSQVGDNPLNGTTAEYFSGQLTVNGNPLDRTSLSAQVRFREEIGQRKIIISGAGSIEGILKIRSVHVVTGMRRGCGGYAGAPIKSTPGMSETDIANATYGINIMNKHPGRMVYDITNDRLLVSQGADPSSPWADTAGVVQITPS